MAFWAAASPDGANVYVSGGIGNAIAVLDRNPSTGALTQPSGPAGCLRNRSGGTTQGGPEAQASGCQLVDGLVYPRTVALDPGGAFLYSADFDSDSISIFRRSAGGTLTPAPGGCVSSRTAPSCGPAANLRGATDLAISADGHFLYTTAFRGNAVDAFARDPQTGALRQVAGSGGCLASVATASCQLGRGLRGAYNLALSPDGHNLYVASRYSAALAVLDRDPVSGALSQRAGSAACLASVSGEGCQAGRGLQARDHSQPRRPERLHRSVLGLDGRRLCPSCQRLADPAVPPQRMRKRGATSAQLSGRSCPARSLGTCRQHRWAVFVQRGRRRSQQRPSDLRSRSLRGPDSIRTRAYSELFRRA